MPYFLRFNKFQISPSRPLPSPKNSLLCTTQNRAGPPAHTCAGVSVNQRPPPPPPQTSKASPARGGAAPRPANTLPAHRTRSPATYLRRGRCFASARRQTSRQTAAYPSPPVPGHNVGRAFTPAAAPLRHHTTPQTAACVDLQYAPAAPPFPPYPLPPPPPRRKPPKPPLQGEVPPQAAEGCRTSPCQYPSGSQHSPVIAHPVQTPDALPPASPSSPQNKNRGPAFRRTAISACLFP